MDKDREKEWSAKEMVEGAVSIVARAGGLMSFEKFDEALQERIGHLNPHLLREKLIKGGELEELKGRDYLRVPIELPQRNE